MRMRTYFICFLLAVGSWFAICQWNFHEQLAIQEAFSSTLDQEIPRQAIRLRILANSDQMQDQWLKQKIRDEVIQEIKGWAVQPKNITEARQIVKHHLARFQNMAEETIHHYGYTYPVKIDFGKVPFPTKLYGTKIYPAGNYEALRITIGKGEGGNWWCVLFPPLCFIDMSNGDAISDPQSERNMLSTSIAPSNQVFAAPTPLQNREKNKPVEVRFLFLDQLSEMLK
jgi:stage II sporulation protein R